MFSPRLPALFILLPANPENNSSCVSLPHKCLLVLDCFAFVAFGFKRPFYLYKHLELSKHEENTQPALENKAVIRAPEDVLQPTWLSAYTRNVALHPTLHSRSESRSGNEHRGLQQGGPGINTFNLLLLQNNSFSMISERENT